MKRLILNIKVGLVKVINLFGYELVHKSKTSPNHSMQFALRRLSKLYNDIDLIIDIGASDGSWSKMAYGYWPKSTYFLFDPLKDKYDIQLELLAMVRNRYFPIALGDYDGMISFDLSSDIYGSGVYGKSLESAYIVDVRKLDTIIEDIEIYKRILVKFDTHGYEIPIIKGSKKVLSCASIVIVEVYGFYISNTTKLFHEVSSILEELGFRLYDIVDIVRREGDEAFWQCDAVYVSKKNEVFLNNVFKK
jgi:FkbM family methyltransferase